MARSVGLIRARCVGQEATCIKVGVTCSISSDYCTNYLHGCALCQAELFSVQCKGVSGVCVFVCECVWAMGILYFTL